LPEAGFEGYFVDFRRGMVSYYLPGGDSVELSGAKASIPVGAAFNPVVVLRGLHRLIPGTTRSLLWAYRRCSRRALSQRDREPAEARRSRGPVPTALRR